MVERAVGEYLIEIGYAGEWNAVGDTAEECWSTLTLKNWRPEQIEKLDKESFIMRVNELANEYALKQVREKRTALLAECDWVVLSDVVVHNVEEWKTYRQALRDLPSSITDFDAEVIYPDKPN
tara:strand:- start:282 stop:650 length:369 start_codon:yes stop_codon:yes gene_type:complete